MKIIANPMDAWKVGEQVQDLRLHRHVQRRDRLVRDDDIGCRQNGAGDADTLALAAAQFVREMRGERGIEADIRQRLLDLALPVGFVVEQPVDIAGFGDRARRSNGAG